MPRFAGLVAVLALGLLPAFGGPWPRQKSDPAEEFRRRYVLAPGEDLKRIPPWSPGERAAYYNGLFNRRGGEGHRANEIQVLYFRQEGDKLGSPSATIGGAGGKVGGTLSSLLNHLLGIYPQDVEGTKDLVEAFVEGDFVARKGVPDERLVERLGVILRDECKLPVRLSLREIDRDVVVAKGRYRYRRGEGKPGGGTLDMFDVYGVSRPENSGAGGGSGDFDEMLRWAGRFTEPNTRVVNEATGLPKGNVEWRLFERSPSTAQTRAEDHDKALIFEHLAEQTGLTFAFEERKVKTLFVEPAEPKTP